MVGHEGFDHSGGLDEVSLFVTTRHSDMSEAGRFAEQIKRQLPDMEPGTLRFWGEWFGRPYDNWHRLISCDAEANLLHMHFNEEEILSIWAPHDLRIGPGRVQGRPILQIRLAERVRWEWFHYGRPHIAANRYFKEFVKTADGIETTTNWYVPTSNPVATEAAVEIL
jgi:hypothetical protein